MSFTEKVIRYNQQLESIEIKQTQLETEKAQAAQVLNLTKEALYQISLSKRSAQQELDTAALMQITEQDNQDAWKYIRERTNYTDESWQIIKERLPKLLKTKNEPNEIYLHIRAFIENEWGSEINQASVFASSDLSININSDCIQLQNTAVIDGLVSLLLGFPKKVESYRKPFIDYSGALIGHSEVTDFLTEIQNEPMYGGLMYRVALELCSNSQTLQYWHDLPNNTRNDILHDCLGEIIISDPSYLNEGGFFDSANMRDYKNALYLKKVLNVIYAESKDLFDYDSYKQQELAAKKLLDKFPDLALRLEDSPVLLNKIDRAETFILLNRKPRLDEPYEH